MIKKIIACLTICFVITGIILPVSSNASALPQPNWSDPGISEIINISDLTGWMLNGGTYDVSTYTDAESFMNDYFSARTKTRLEGSDYQIKSSFGLEQQYYQIGDSAYAHPLDVNRAISSSFRDHSGYGRRFSNEVNDALLSTGNLYDTKIPLLNEVEFANFVGYNHDALKLYTLEFGVPEQPDPVPHPDFSFLDNIGYLYVRNMEFVQNESIPWAFNNGSGQIASWNFNRKDVSYYSPSTSLRHTYIDNNYMYYGSLGIYNGILSVNFNTESNQAEYFGADPYSGVLFTSVNGDNSGNSILNVFKNYGTYNGVMMDYMSVNGTSTNTWSPRTDFTGAGLSTFCNYIYNQFANINIYVDGDLWVSSEPSAPRHITPEFPDAVGGEELSSTTWPIFRPRAPYYTNVPGVLQAIEDAISDDGVLDIDDLKPYLTDANGDPIPDPVFDPEPVPIPVPDPVNPDVVPGLPELPIIPINMPGYNGVSVLAEIINFTNQSLPTSLIVTFWGIVFGIVILGLIKILHK